MQSFEKTFKTNKYTADILLGNGSINSSLAGLGGLGVTCSPRDPRFAGSSPAEVDGFFQDVKILSTSPQDHCQDIRIHD